MLCTSCVVHHVFARHVSGIFPGGFGGPPPPLPASQFESVDGRRPPPPALGAALGARGLPVTPHPSCEQLGGDSTRDQLLMRHRQRAAS